MRRILATKFKGSFTQAEKCINKGIPIAQSDNSVRKSVKDMAVKYWLYKMLKNKIDDIDIIVGIIDGYVYSAFNVDNYEINVRPDGNERVEFMCETSANELVGIDFGTSARDGGWTLKTYSEKELELIKKSDDNEEMQIEARKKYIFTKYEVLKLPYDSSDNILYGMADYSISKNSRRTAQSTINKTKVRCKHTCEVCGGVYSRCHHILRLAMGGAINDENNTMGLCKCHDIFHKNYNTTIYDTFIYPLLKQYREKTCDICVWTGIKKLVNESPSDTLLIVQAEKLLEMFQSVENVALRKDYKELKKIVIKARHEIKKEKRKSKQYI